MSLATKRYRYLVPLGILFLGVLVYYGTHRIMPTNIGNNGKITTDRFDIKNTINLFDITQTHEIKILMTEEELQDMIDSYANTSKKKWYKIDVIIDGVTVYDVGVRLKGNLILKQRIGNGFPIKSMANYDKKLPLLIKFDKYITQTYQGHEMIVLRVEREEESPFLAEPYGYTLYQQIGQPAPDTSHGLVEINGKNIGLYIISEIPEDKYYIQKWFGNDNGVLYKAGNFVYFGFLGEDSALYSDYFMQKTRMNDYDLSPLIEMLKFITESDDEEFEEKIGDYVDIESVLTNLAIDDFLCNLDSFGGNGSNFYLYYNLGEKKFYLLTRDQDLAVRRGCVNGIIKGADGSNILLSGKKENILKERLLSSSHFKTMYDEIYKKIEKIAVRSDFTENFFSEWKNVSSDYRKKYELKNSIDYGVEVHRLGDYINSKGNM